MSVKPLSTQEEAEIRVEYQILAPDGEEWAISRLFATLDAVRAERDKAQRSAEIARLERDLARCPVRTGLPKGGVSSGCVLPRDHEGEPHVWWEPILARAEKAEQRLRDSADELYGGAHTDLEFLSLDIRVLRHRAEKAEARLQEVELDAVHEEALRADAEDRIDGLLGRLGRAEAIIIATQDALAGKPYPWAVPVVGVERLLTRLAAYREALEDAVNQIEYLHEKFMTTGTGVAVIQRIKAALSGAPTDHRCHYRESEERLGEALAEIADIADFHGPIYRVARAALAARPNSPEAPKRSTPVPHHVTTEEGDCVSWCAGCRHARSNPPGSSESSTAEGEE